MLTVVNDRFYASGSADTEDDKQRKHSDIVGYKYTCEGETYICNNISNVVEFKFFIYSYTDSEGVTHAYDEDLLPLGSITESDDNLTYTQVSDIFNNKTGEFDDYSKPITFFDDATKQKSKSDFIEVNDLDPTTRSLVLYVQYNYNESLIQSFLQDTELIENDNSALAARVTFLKDIEIIAFTTDEVEGTD